MPLIRSLTHNPYRVLGLVSTASAAEVAERARVFEDGPEETPLDLSERLGVVDRSTEAVREAQEMLSTDEGRIASAFFWFAQMSSPEALAFNFLKEGNFERAEKAFSKKKGYVLFVHQAVLSFMKGDLLGGIGHIAKLLDEETEWRSFIRDVTGRGVLFSRAGLSLLFLRELSRDEFVCSRLGLQHIDDETTADDFMREIFAIRERLAISIQNVGVLRSMPIMALKSAQRLLDTTEDLFSPLKAKLGADSPLYLYVSSWIANEALSMIVANVNFMQSCPPGTETLRTESMKAKVLLERLLTRDITPPLRAQIEKNLALLEELLEGIRDKHDRGYCYIATMVYQDYDADEVLVLRDFRDRILSRYAWGRAFISVYYRYSPRLVYVLQGRSGIHVIVRKLLDIFVFAYARHLASEHCARQRKAL